MLFMHLPCAARYAVYSRFGNIVFFERIGSQIRSRNLAVGNNYAIMSMHACRGF